MTTHSDVMTGPTIYRPECGTAQGWWAHRRGLERPCQPCRKAVAIGLRAENMLSLDQAMGELRDRTEGRRFWNPNLPEPKRVKP